MAKNYEIVHDQVGPFARDIYVTKDGVRTLKLDDKGKPVSRVVSEAVIDKTSPATDEFEGNRAVWLRVGAIKATDADETQEPMEVDTLNGRKVPGTPAHTEAAAANMAKLGGAPKPATTATTAK